MNYLIPVAEFHRTFGAPVLETPQIPTSDRCKLRVSLLAEELDEFREAIAAGDLHKVADALCDLQYVLSGAVLEFGLQNKFPDLFQEVQRANMSKLCSSEEEFHQTVQFYQNQGIDVYGESVGDDKWIIYRKYDRKILKSINWSEPDFSPILP